MGHESGHSMLADGLVLLAAGLLFVMIFRRIGLGATLGYLVAGAIVGPYALGLAGDAEEMIVVAELGIVMLLFVVGLELAPARLWEMKGSIFGLGLLQVALCGLALTALLGLAMPLSWAAALALGLPLALSSTAQVLPMLQSTGRLGSGQGQRAFSILLFQDLSIIPLITIVAALSATSDAAETMPAWQLALVTVAVIAGLVAAGRFLLRPLFRLIGNWRERELFVVAALFTVVGSAALMEAIGLSTALGAFIAGVMLADTPYRHELEADIEPFRSILLGLFFLSVGMMLDLTVIASQPVFVLLAAAALIAVKTAVITGIGAMFGMAWRSALSLGLLLSQGGEFAFVLFTQAQSGGVITAEQASLFGAVVTLSMLTTPFLMRLGDWMRGPKTDKGTREEPAADGATAIVIGFGRFGQTVAQMLRVADIGLKLIDRKVEQIDLAGEFGSKVYYGDGTRIDLLRQAGAEDAQAIIFCIDGEQVDVKLLEGVSAAFPNAKVYVRAFDRGTVVALREAPVAGVVRELLDSAVRMGREALSGLGFAQDELERIEQSFRARDQQRLDQQIDAGDLRAAKESYFDALSEFKGTGGRGDDMMDDLPAARI
ncbi:cation:proton antiporter domain-containing protein [Qipengyuania atrilutea]|uniref:Cation:proton antiporter n=1 Tax=Qipengyuania atrilutea TaxID=2744473 RepID=A0A850H3E7_9SPHN|nr:cation:proton antiporter [Actirhodobacter atriluteus]NVD44722.1 cation:proton antiporter [Actirhodobacter atriluteus]